MAIVKHITRFATCLSIILLAACSSEAPAPSQHAARPGPGYVGSDACQSCHATQYADWQRSHHQMAMQPATPESVLGDFSGATFEFAGITYEYFTRDGTYIVRADDENGAVREFEISHTFGIEPLQQYLVAFPDGRLQALSVAWDTRPEAGGGQRWFHLYPDESITHEDELHWTGRNFNWNFMCADCHSTDVRKNYDPAADAFETGWAEVTVGCEACHGPGSVHIENARRGLRDALDLHHALDSQMAQIDTCARCHARRGILAEGFVPGDAFLDHYRPALLDAGLYHADGQILDEVYVYGSFLQSRMYLQGVRCTDCHNPHSAELDVAGNGTCTVCHQAEPPDRFPTLDAKVYDHPDHHFHEPGSDGAQCVNCHMSERYYMVVDGRRDHSFRIPRPDISEATGAPNACNDCHRDRDSGWAAAEIARRFPGAKPKHYGEALAAGRRQDADAAARLAALATDTNIPAIVRGTALSLLAVANDATSPAALVKGLRDAEPLVRLGALKGLDGLNIELRWQLAQHLLDDELLAVRSGAGVTLAPMLELALRQADQERLLAAVEDYIDTQRLNADRPEALTNLGSIYTQTGADEAAEKAFLRALTIEPDWVPAMLNLADFYRGENRDAEAGKLFARAKSVAPENGAVRHAYGLHLVRQGRPDDALIEFAEAVSLVPDNPRYRYVYGVALNSMGRGDEAVRVLAAGLTDFPRDTDMLFALATMERDRGNSTEALGYVDRLLELQPGNPQLLQLKRQLEAVSEQ